MTEHRWVGTNIDRTPITFACECGHEEGIHEEFVYLGDKPHGLSGYVRNKCRCHVCRTEKNASQARYRKKIGPKGVKAQRVASRRHKARKKSMALIRSRTDSALPDDWTW